jgi:glucose-1-phosphate cytidylyltransferase
MNNRSIRAVILCGGKGTRAYPHTVDVPKPLLEVGGKPVLQHLLEIYARQGHTDFVLAAGYRVDLIAEFAKATSPSTGWSIDVVDTGLETGTGERIQRVAERAGDTFFVNYADGLGDVDLGCLLEFHRAHGHAATLTTVPLPSPYGTIDLGPGNRVERFVEKPRLHDHRINAGFFVFNAGALDRAPGADLERDVLPALSAAGELHAYDHPGFWRSLDTYKDALELTALCDGGAPPWVARSSDRAEA